MSDKPISVHHGGYGGVFWTCRDGVNIFIEALFWEIHYRNIYYISQFMRFYS
jgi:hypothetical protein